VRSRGFYPMGRRRIGARALQRLLMSLRPNPPWQIPRTAQRLQELGSKKPLHVVKVISLPAPVAVIRESVRYVRMMNRNPRSADDGLQ
jgi:hypothetical protein